jgi:putative membrane protein
MNMNGKIPLILGALAVAALGNAQVPIAKDGRVEKLHPPKSGLNAQDGRFIMDAAAGNTFEVRSSQLAIKNGNSAFVKQFAKEMVLDHGSAFEELKLIAHKKGRMVSKKLPAKLQATIDRLSRLRGAAFDSAYQSAQKAAHTETAAKIKKEIEAGRDGDVRSYAEKILPAVEMHQKMLATKRTMTGATKMRHGM